jgi:hypothetical protein
LEQSSFVQQAWAFILGEVDHLCRKSCDQGLFRHLRTVNLRIGDDIARKNILLSLGIEYLAMGGLATVSEEAWDWRLSSCSLDGTVAQDHHREIVVVGQCNVAVLG